MRTIHSCSEICSVVMVSVLYAAIIAYGAQAPGGGPATPPPPTGSGPYKAVMEMDARLPGYTIYRPKDVADLGNAQLPIVLWGNGACANTGNLFQPFLTEISSYGYLVIALGPIRKLKPER